MDRAAAAAERARLLADLEARRRRHVTMRRRARWTELTAASALGLATAVSFRALTGGGVGAMVLGAGNWLFTILFGLVAFVATRGVISAVAARRLLPARREVAAAESRLYAHDAAHGRR